MVRVIESGSWAWMVGSWWCGMRAREALSATGFTPKRMASKGRITGSTRWLGYNADDAEVVPPALCVRSDWLYARMDGGVECRRRGGRPSRAMRG